MPQTVALIVAAGRGSRMPGESPKQYQDLCGRTILRHALEAFVIHPDITDIRAVIHPEDANRYVAATRGLTLAPPVIGGKTRQESVHNGLAALASGTAPEQVLIHDSARPFVSLALIDRVIGALSTADGAIPTLPVNDTVKRAAEGRIAATLDREGLHLAQTPQGFCFPALLEAHNRAAADRSVSYTDDASIAEAAGLHVAAVDGDVANIKITHVDDMSRAAAWLRGERETRVGSGFDVHAFGPGDAVRLCGVDIPHDRALDGHSDADVALHALTDAILGALGDGDIGSHFPPSDLQWRGKDSMHFLAHAADLLRTRNGALVHADLTIICEHPNIGPHREAMCTRVAEALAVDRNRISVKATTTEGLGFTGRAEGIAAQASATISIKVGR
ncbi:MAG: bifunctional 2-C-methyl-D-erythritol 4-phosphate cytidylyltransferase/2-C-methyl-D-erythritol 2,4-cyclodiphosphate synthase [Alphaproteobacteria bacterium]|nr:bifunctional 2-C-methyl-D-erythritol 4-phosphate cytidylyltransferase/2-C-methyl-D-erythritol 2,4-cyclodiphosphate synthase [Alphaproteobacteria bacterium]HCP01233.1 bifunctional 2-C-methyl-D-erythritol 4-phosphate cytidylyltransferase/2-C-methyl-D-erythritol 2,4-cyclodiphosphate synthase [Rhodospirillaceae bacterium]